MTSHHNSITVIIFLSLLVLVTVTSEINGSKTECPPWFFYNSDTGDCQCHKDSHLEYDIHCTKNGVLVEIGNCMTYSENKGTFFARCFYYQFPPDNITTLDGNNYFSVPENVSELNDYMCGPIKRKGVVCSECLDGLGPSVTSFGYKCTNCSDPWKQVVIYILVEFGPTTLFYFLVLFFRISITSAPMTCFILYSQIIVYALFQDRGTLNGIIQNQSQSVKYLMLTVGSLYGIWNLDFLQYLVPPLCISSSLSIIHVDFLSCLSTLYSLFLVGLTWICIELHAHNFKPLVLLWKPFHSCFVRLRRRWNTNKDMIDVFATFLYLSYSKLTYQSVQMLTSQYILKDDVPYARVSLNDPSIPYFGRKHLPFAICAMLIWLVLVIPPALILFLYPTKAFNVCLTKCKLNGRPGVALMIFTEKFYGCYKDHLNGGCDMRKFSVFYFILRPVLILLHQLHELHVSEHMWFFAIVLFASVSILIAYAKPYKEPYMNLLDTLLLAHLALLCLLLITPFKDNYNVAFILLTLPLIIFLLLHILRFMLRFKHTRMVARFSKYRHYRRSMLDDQVEPSTQQDGQTNEECQVLIQPTTLNTYCSI